MLREGCRPQSNNKIGVAAYCYHFLSKSRTEIMKYISWFNLKNIRNFSQLENFSVRSTMAVSFNIPCKLGRHDIAGETDMILLKIWRLPLSEIANIS